VILPKSFTQEWIMTVRDSSPRIDPILIEKMIMALTLVEKLRISGLEFIFKGGTSLALVLGKIQRFSIDVDILVPNTHNIVECFESILNMEIFLRYEEDKRDSTLPKSHYKFFYYSNIQSKESYILLDILYMENPYEQLQNVEIQSPLLMIDDESIQVVCPLPECLLGDKLTAFAPHTTGIRYRTNKELEIVKQLFDIATLFDIVNDVELISTTHNRISTKELMYREMEDCTPHHVLMDSFSTACMIGMNRGDGNPDEYAELLNGVSKLRGFIFSQNFSLSAATLCASKVALLVAWILEKQKDIIRFDKRIDLSTWNISNTGYNKINKLKRINPEAFFYFFHAFQCMKLN
jgi:hypothetical protein